MTRVAIVKDNVSPLLEVVIWLCLVLSLLTVLVRLATKRYILRRIDPDDYFIIISSLCASAQSIAISLATSNGLGQHLRSLDVTQLSALLKAQYSASLLFITSICFAKLSLVVFLRNLTPLAFDRKFILVIGLVVALWAVTAILTAAFQCHLPTPWDYVNQLCFNRLPWANYVAVMNVLTDIALIVVPLVIVVRLKASHNKKRALMLLFLARVCVIAAVVSQIFYLDRLKISNDLTFDIWRVTICTQTAQFLGISTACLVDLRPFLDGLETGFIQVGGLRRRHIPGFGYRLGEVPRNPKDLNQGLSFSSLRLKLSRSQPQTDDIEPQDKASAGLKNLGNNAASDTEQHERDTHSRSRILRTVSFRVERDPSLRIPPSA